MVRLSVVIRRRTVGANAESGIVPAFAGIPGCESRQTRAS